MLFDLLYPCITKYVKIRIVVLSKPHSIKAYTKLPFYNFIKLSLSYLDIEKMLPFCDFLNIISTDYKFNTLEKRIQFASGENWLRIEN